MCVEQCVSCWHPRICHGVLEGLLFVSLFHPEQVEECPEMVFYSAEVCRSSCLSPQENWTCWTCACARRRYACAPSSPLWTCWWRSAQCFQNKPPACRSASLRTLDVAVSGCLGFVICSAGVSCLQLSWWAVHLWCHPVPLSQECGLSPSPLAVQITFRLRS